MRKAYFPALATSPSQLKTPEDSLMLFLYHILSVSGWALGFQRFLRGKYQVNRAVDDFALLIFALQSFVRTCFYFSSPVFGTLLLSFANPDESTAQVASTEKANRELEEKLTTEMLEIASLKSGLSPSAGILLSLSMSKYGKLTQARHSRQSWLGLAVYLFQRSTQSWNAGQIVYNMRDMPVRVVHPVPKRSVASCGATGNTASHRWNSLPETSTKIGSKKSDP